MSNPLYEEMGLAVNLVAPSTLDTDAGLTGSDNSTFRIEGYRGALIIVSAGGLAGSQNVNIQYASSGAASDLAEITTATDAVFTALDTDWTSPEVMWLDFGIAGLSDAAGIIGVNVANVDSDSGGRVSVIAIPWGGDQRLPISQTNTVLVRG